MKLGLKIVFLFMALITCKELLAQNNLTYKQLIEEADLYLKVGEIGFARIDYDKAITMNPSDEYPRLKLAEIDRKAITQHRNDSIFEESLLNAEKYFKAGNFNLAQIEYKQSLELKPESEFIKGRLATISASASKTNFSKAELSVVTPKTETTKTLALIDKQKKDQRAYNDIILAAEKAVASKNTQQAITYYEKAAAIYLFLNVWSDKFCEILTFN